MALMECRTAADVEALYRATAARKAASRVVPQPVKASAPEPVKTAPASQPAAAVALPPAVIFLQADEWLPVKDRVVRPMTVSKILNVVSWFYQVGRLDMISPSRRSCVTGPRQVAMYLIRRLTRRSLIETGNIFGGRDHSTVHHAVHKIARLRLDDPDMREALIAIEKELAA